MSNQGSSDFTLDFKKWFFRLLSYWWLFVLFLSISVGLGHFYLKNSTPLYSTSAKVMIKGVGGGGLSASSILADGLGIQSGGQEMSNVIEIFKSRPIVERAVEAMDGNVRYFAERSFGQVELDRTSSIKLDFYELADQRQIFSFYVVLGSSGTFEFKANLESGGTTHSFGEPFDTQFGKFQISKGPFAKLSEGEIIEVRILTTSSMVGYFQRSLEMDIVGTAASNILRLKVIDPLPNRTREFIAALIEAYNEAEIDDNAQVLRSTLKFVEERITALEIELDSIESGIERFKSENNIITQTATGSLGFALSELRSGTTALTDFQVEEELLNSLQEILEKEESGLIPTNFLGIAPTLSGFIGQYNDLIIRRKNLKQSVSELSPTLIQLNRRILDLQEVMMESIVNLRKDLQIPINQTRQQVLQAEKDLKMIPFVEKQLLEKLRMQATKEGLFLFLLRKKEETELSLAIASANTRVLEEARSSGGPVFPRTELTRIGSIILGLLLPILIVSVLGIFNNKIDSEDTVKDITSVPIIGRVPKYNPKENLLLSPKERSIRSEMFRLIRTNLNFINLKKDSQVLSVTSSMTGEGKTITSINLGLTIAWSGKKVILVDLDLRKPKVAQYLGARNEHGVTSCLSGAVSLQETIQKTDGENSLHFITSGPIPPNPSEMIMSDEMKAIIAELKAAYDVIIIDCPPIGAVADGLLLREYVNNMLYVVRHKKTTKDALRYMEEQYQKGELANPLLVINSIVVSKSSSSYGGYNAGYGKGYYFKDK